MLDPRHGLHLSWSRSTNHSREHSTKKTVRVFDCLSILFKSIFVAGPRALGSSLSKLPYANRTGGLRQPPKGNPVQVLVDWKDLETSGAAPQPPTNQQLGRDENDGRNAHTLLAAGRDPSAGASAKPSKKPNKFLDFF